MNLKRKKKSTWVYNSTLCLLQSKAENLTKQNKKNAIEISVYHFKYMSQFLCKLYFEKKKKKRYTLLRSIYIY